MIEVDISILKQKAAILSALTWHTLVGQLWHTQLFRVYREAFIPILMHLMHIFVTCFWTGYGVNKLCVIVASVLCHWYERFTIYLYRYNAERLGSRVAKASARHTRKTGSIAYMDTMCETLFWCLPRWYYWNIAITILTVPLLQDAVVTKDGARQTWRCLCFKTSVERLYY